MEFFHNLGQLRAALEVENAIVLCDSNTFRHCYQLLGIDLNVIVATAGEENKSLRVCEKIWTDLIRLGADRSTTLICLGGGVISDLGAYAASQFMRGIDFTLIPTSLMAMVDASIGGKAAINFNHLKNYIGGYYKPADHFIYHGFLETLPQEECLNGITEMLKHGLIADPEHYQDVVPLINDVKIPSLELIQRSQDIKHGYVLEDYHEQSVRKQLNFGHTIGHALESLAAYKQEKLSHGMAVGMGILIESEISRECMDLSDSELLRIQSDMHPYIIEFQNLELEEDLLMGFIRKDKKNDSGKILFSLLDGIGACRQDQEVEEALIIKCLKSVQEL